jgi:hypothetical protein
MSDPLDDDRWNEAAWEHRAVEETPEAKAARTRRNWVLAGVLLAFVLTVFVVTIIHLGGHVLD